MTSERAEAARLGVDTGGTFTDVIKRSADGSLRVHKLLSTPHDPSLAIGDGVVAILDDDEACGEVIHGTTVATNALLERRGSKLAFVTTRGFEDLLWMRRQTRPELYALNIEMTPPLVQGEMCFGVAERLDATGAVIVELSDEEVERVVTQVEETDAEAVVICLLHAYANGEHEERLAKAFRARKRAWHVTNSREVTATFREYERASTAAINAYVGPVMSRYLQRLIERLDEVGLLEVLQSHGGRASADHAGRLPVHTVLSGPAGGVVGAVEAGKEVGVDRIISFDMGGTSTDVSLAQGEPTLTEEGTIGGLPLQVPVIDIYTVGAGGGSIAYVDPGGALRVGPRSSGADPGPAAYGRGGVEPTVTDAHVALGSLRADRFLGGTMSLDRKAALETLEKLGAQIEMDWRQTARGILDVADAAMARAIKVISLERGYDPRDYTLAAFGGAGGLHACRLAQTLEMSRVLVPRFPGILSATGMLRSQSRRLYSQTVLRPLQACLDGRESSRLRAMMAELEELARERMGQPAPKLSWTASLRYAGQSFSIAVAVDWMADGDEWSDPGDRFEEEHQRLYGYADRQRAIELVDVRLVASRPAPSWASSQAWEPRVESRRESREMIDVGEGPQEIMVVERAGLAEGDVIEGPAIITEYSGTTVVLSSWRAEVQRGHLLICRKEA